MTLETLLHEAAPEATFEPDDVRQRVDRSRRRHRAAVGGIAVVLVLVTAISAWAALGRDEERTVIAGEPEGTHHAVAITEAALVGSRWVAVGPRTGADAPWVSFLEDGTWTASRECRPSSGRWSIRHGRLRLQGAERTRLDGCSPRSGEPTTLAYLTGTTALLDDGVLQFTVTRPESARTLTFQRLDRLGRTPAVDDLAGEWWLGSQVATWDEDTFSIGQCTWAWSIDGDRLQAYSNDCPSSSPTIPLGFTDAGPWTVTARLDGDTLYLVGPQHAVRFVRSNGPPLADLAGYWLAEGTDGSLLTDFHLEVFLGDGTDPAILGLPNGPSIRIAHDCDLIFATLTLSGAALDIEETQRLSGYCQASEQGELLPTGASDRSGPDFTLEGDELVSSGGLRYRHLSPATADDLVGSWQTDRSGQPFRTVIVTFGPDGSATFGTCRFGEVVSTTRGTEVVGRGAPCTGVEGQLLDVGDRRTAYVEDGVLYLARPGTVDALTPVTFDAVEPPPGLVDGVASTNPAEELLLSAYAEMGVDQCCAQLSEGGQLAEVGFLWQGTQILVTAQPGDGTTDLVGSAILDGGAVLTETDLGTAVVGVCRGFEISVHEEIAAGEISDGTLIAAAGALFDALGCG
jgi:hypothetical protein